MAKGDRILKVARARVMLPAAGGVWTAAAVMHAAHGAPLEAFLGSAAVTGITYGSPARSLAGTVGAAGAWFTAAAAYGPAAGPYDLMTIAWGAGALVALAVAGRHPAVLEAKRWRDARRELHASAYHLGIGGAHLVHHEQTRLGEAMELDVTGTGKLASQIARSNLAERIAQDKGLPLPRVQVSDPRPGRVRVSIRYTDPWKRPIPHPVLTDSHEITLPVPCTIREPLPVGQDPETGSPLTVTLWDEAGAKTVMVVAKRREGKTTLGNCLRERITAAEDADLWNINLSKAQEDREWARACEHSACGPGERKKALAILRAARRLIDQRGATPRDTAVFQPTADDRLKVIWADEVDELVKAGGAWVREELGYIASKAGSEGVALVIAGQRATNDWMGGGAVKANIDSLILGKVRTFGEINHAAGSMAALLPDMTSYGEGHKGVWVVSEDGGEQQKGRAFNLCELTDIRRIAAERSRRAPELVGAGKLPASNLPAGNNSPADGPPSGFGYDAPSSDDTAASAPVHGEHDDARRREEETLAHMDAQLDGIPDDLQEQLARIDKRNAETRRILGETNRMPPPVSVDPEAKARSTAERWRQVGEQTVIPEDHLQPLLDLLAGVGTTIKAVSDQFEVSVWTARTWLEKLRQAGAVEIVGRKRGARWRLTRRDTQ